MKTQRNTNGLMMGTLAVLAGLMLLPTENAQAQRGPRGQRGQGGPTTVRPAPPVPTNNGPQTGQRGPTGRRPRVVVVQPQRRPRPRVVVVQPQRRPRPVVVVQPQRRPRPVVVVHRPVVRPQRTWYVKYHTNHWLHRDFHSIDDARLFARQMRGMGSEVKAYRRNGVIYVDYQMQEWHRDTFTSQAEAQRRLLGLRGLHFDVRLGQG